MAKKPKNNEPQLPVEAVQPPAEGTGTGYEPLAKEKPTPAPDTVIAPTISRPDCPLLQSLLRDLGLPLLPRYTKSDLVQVLGAKPRTIQEWMRDGRLPSRRMPNNFRCFPSDLEEFLQNSRVDSDSSPLEGGDA